MDPKNMYNFALLKKTKPYEPGWIYKTKSQNRFVAVNNVRPGWSIECSAMNSAVYGCNFDIHAGGIDLKFPHHACEKQQGDARYKINENDIDCISHFLHMGHLNSLGEKMSRSLKNFITIPEMMQKYSHNQIRILFLLHQWADPMDFSEETMKHAIFFTDLFKNFFLQTKSILLRPTTKRHKKFGPQEIKFFEYLERVKLNVGSALRSNIDTPSVIKLLHELVSSLFIYVTDVEKSEINLSEEIINDTVNYVSSILVVFGLDFDNNKSNDGKENELLKVIQDIRSEMRNLAKNIVIKVKPLDNNLASELQQNVYKLSDTIRDQILPDLGFTITDK